MKDEPTNTRSISFREGYRAAMAEVWRRFLSNDGIEKTLRWIEQQQKGAGA